MSSVLIIVKLRGTINFFIGIMPLIRGVHNLMHNKLFFYVYNDQCILLFIILYCKEYLKKINLNYCSNIVFFKYLKKKYFFGRFINIQTNKLLAHSFYLLISCYKYQSIYWGKKYLIISNMIIKTYPLPQNKFLIIMSIPW